MGYTTIKLEREGNVALLILNRHEVHNAMDQAMFLELKSAAGELSLDPEVRAVVITGEGPSFSSGLDLGSFQGLDKLTRRHFYALLKELQGAFLAYETMAKPVIAAVNGLAYGAGTELALACDIRFASENASFGLLEIKFGIIPDLGACRRLARLVGPGYARELIYTGDVIDAREAHRIGLVEHLCPGDRVLDEALGLARRLADGPPLAIGMAKQAILRGLDADPETALEFEAMAQTLCLYSEDHREAVRSFLEKRKPDYRGN
ncbi:MAG: enoyl-CoA hydratase/isomerase family protein [Candidatus Geothermincolales bacterium]